VSDVTDEFEVYALRMDISPDYVTAEIYHKPCGGYIYIALELGREFECDCDRRYRVEKISPLKIVEVKRRE
jgi:hypothetical protein